MNNHFYPFKVCNKILTCIVLSCIHVSADKALHFRLFVRSVKGQKSTLKPDSHVASIFRKTSAITYSIFTLLYISFTVELQENC